MSERYLLRRNYYISRADGISTRPITVSILLIIRAEERASREERGRRSTYIFRSHGCDILNAYAQTQGSFEVRVEKVKEKRRLVGDFTELAAKRMGCSLGETEGVLDEAGNLREISNVCCSD